MAFIHLISSPRNISTALMYAFAQRKDTFAVDEPFYAYYLTKNTLEHPGRAEILASQPQSISAVVNNLLNLRDSHSLVFIKNMAHHMGEDYPDEITQDFNILLIRDPEKIIASYHKVIPNPTLEDLGIESQYNVYQKLNAEGHNPVVVDSGLLLQNPKAVLQKLCESLSIAFDPNMCSWSPGPKPMDGVWAKHWYANVHQSSGFTTEVQSKNLLPEGLKKLNATAQTYYEKLLSLAIKP